MADNLTIENLVHKKNLKVFDMWSVKFFLNKHYSPQILGTFAWLFYTSEECYVFFYNKINGVFNSGIEVLSIMDL